MLVIAIGVLMLAAALAVDVGRMTSTNRDLQSVADLASLDAVRFLDGRIAAAQQDDIDDQALASAQRNLHGGVVGDTLVVDLGVVAPDGSFVVAVPGDVPTAVRVRADRNLDYLFVAGGRTLHRDAVASRSNLAGITIGSFALAVDASTVPLLNGLFSTRLGGPVNLSLVGYQGLATANVTLGQLAAAAGVGTVSELVALDLTMDQFFTVLIDALNARGDLEAFAVLGTLATLQSASTVTGTVRIGDLVRIESGSGDAAASVDLLVGDLVRGTATVISESQLIELDPSASVPGLVDAMVKATVIEGTRSVIGGPGSEVSTSQIRLYLELDLVDVLGAPLRVPIAIDVASATARIVDISCDADGTATSITSDVETSAGEVRVGQLTDTQLIDGSTSTTASILDVPLVVSVEADSHTAVGQQSQLIVHTPLFDENNTIRVGGGFDGDSVSGDVNLYATVLGPAGAGLDVDALLRPQIEQVLVGLEPTIDRLLVINGAIVGGADVTAFHAGCGSPRLLR